jgi:hypothetical protein
MSLHPATEAMLFSINVNNLRREGLTDAAIALQLNASPQAVASVRLPKPDPQRQRSVQALQLQIAAQQVMPRVEAGDMQAINLLLKLQAREASLLGLDAPTEVVQRQFNLTPDNVREMTVDELKRKIV